MIPYYLFYQQKTKNKIANIYRTSAADVLDFGLSLVGYDNQTHLVNNNCSRLPRFKAHYGVGPTTAAAIWNDLVAKQQERENKLDACKLFLSYFDVAERLRYRFEACVLFKSKRKDNS